MRIRMRYLGAFLLPAAFLMSCGSSDNKAVREVSVPKDTVKQCYVANFEGDTAILALKITDTTKVEGTLFIKYESTPQNDGIVRGEFKGDTLYVDYSFKIGEGKGQFSNPLAFLKKDSALVMGVGQIETAYGRSYFVKDKPINYERGKFTFVPKTCE
jgi:hypothetical protein